MTKASDIMFFFLSSAVYIENTLSFKHSLIKTFKESCGNIYLPNENA